MQHRSTILVFIFGLVFLIPVFFNSCGEIKSVDYYQSTLGTLQFDYQSKYVVPGETVEIAVHGGVPPYEYSLEGEGQFDPETLSYTAPQEFGSARLLARDQNGTLAMQEVYFQPAGTLKTVFGSESSQEVMNVAQGIYKDVRAFAMSLLDEHLGLDDLFIDKDYIPVFRSVSVVDIGYQTDGKVIALVATHNALDLSYYDEELKTYPQNDMNFILVRFLENGQVDQSFGLNGVVYTLLELRGNSFFHMPKLMEVLKDDSIVVAGTQGPKDESTYVYVAKYDRNGVPDRSFGRKKNGLSDPLLMTAEYRVSVGKLPEKRLHQLVLQPDGKILLAGGALVQVDAGQVTTGATEAYQALVVRYNSDGTLDSGFGTNGYVHFKFPIPTNFLCRGGSDSSILARSLALLPDGRIAVGAGHPGIAFANYTNLNFCEAANFLFAMLKSDGSFDEDFIPQQPEYPGRLRVNANKGRSGLSAIFSVNAGVADMVYDAKRHKLVAVGSVIDFTAEQWSENGTLVPPTSYGIFPGLVELDLSPGLSFNDPFFTFTQLGFDTPPYTKPLFATPNELLGIMPIFGILVPFNAITQIFLHGSDDFYVSGASLNRYAFALRLKRNRTSGAFEIDSQFNQEQSGKYVPEMPAGVNTYYIGKKCLLGSSISVHPNGQVLMGIGSEGETDKQFAILGLNR